MKKPKPPAIPPNIDTKKDPVPPGWTLIKGSHLSQRATALGLQYGTAWHMVNRWTKTMDGILIRDQDMPKWETKPKPER